MKDTPSYFVCTLGQAALLQQKPAYHTVPEFIDHRAETAGDLPAIGHYIRTEGSAWQGQVLSFRDVQHNTRIVAGTIRDTGELQSEAAVALLCPSSIEFLFTWLALMYLGHPVLLIAPQCSPSAAAHLCKTCEATILFRDDSYKTLAEETSVEASGDGWEVRLRDLPFAGRDVLDTKQAHPSTGFPRRTSVEPTAVAYLHHTSGTSSGTPKPIPQTHQGGLAVLPQLDGGKGATFTTTPLYHGGIADLFRAWTSSAPIWLFPGKDVPITASNVVRCLETAATSYEEGKSPPVSYFSSVPYVLQMVSTDQSGLEHLRTMKMVGVGGAALPNEVGDDLVKKGVNLVSRYGSAECGFLMSSDRNFDEDTAWQYLRHDTRVKQLVFEPREEGLSELVVRPGWPYMARTNREDGSFATSDLFESHPSITNAWKYHSRADSQLTLATGKKFDPSPLESAIAASSDLIGDALIFGEGEAYPGVLLFRSEQASKVSDEELVKTLHPTIKRMNAEAQSHARIPLDMLVAMPPTSIEKSSKGTILRSAATKRFSDAIEAAYASSDDVQHDISNEDLPSAVLDAVKEVIPAGSDEDLSPDADLFAHGVDSVASIRIRNKLKGFLPENANLPLTIVHDTGTVTQLVNHILAIRQGRQPSKSSTREDVVTTMQRLIVEYSALSAPSQAEFITNGTSTSPKHPSTPPEANTILLTGPTGSLGAHLLSHLLTHHNTLNITHIHLLVRGATPDSANQRVLKALTSRHLPVPTTFASLVTVHPTSLSSPHFSLPTPTYTHLLNTVTHVYHLAWQVNFLLYLSAFRPHLSALQQLLTFTLSSTLPQPPKLIFCSSTASTLSHPTPVPEQPLPLPHPSSPPPPTTTGYALSKHTAEAILSRAATLHPRLRSTPNDDTITILRVGQLSAATKTGVWNASEAYPLMLSASAALKAAPDLDRARREQQGGGKIDNGEECAWVPVDVAAQAFVEAGLGGIRDLAKGGGEERDEEEERRQSRKGLKSENVEEGVVRVLHLLPRPGQHSKWGDVLREVLEYEPGAFEIVEMEEWLRRLEGLKTEDGDGHGHDDEDGKGREKEQHPALRLAVFWRQAYCGDSGGGGGGGAAAVDEAGDRAGQDGAKIEGDVSDGHTTSGFEMQRSLQAMPVLKRRPEAVHLDDGYISRCWEWIKEHV